MKRLTLGMCLLLSAALACEPEPRSIEPGAAPSSSALAISNDDRRLIIAAEDHDQVIIMDRQTREVLHRVDVGDAPSHVIVDANGVALVTTRYGHTLTFVDVNDGVVLGSVQVGLEPVGLTMIDRTHVAVALAGEAALAIVNTETRSVDRKIALGTDDPRAVAKVDGKLFVTHMTAGVVSEVILEDDSVRASSIATEIEGPRVHPNLTRSLTVAPDDKMLMIAHSQANSDTMRAPINGPDVDADFDSGACGYSGCAEQLGANTPVVTAIDPISATVVTPPIAPAQERETDIFGNCVSCRERFQPQTPPNFMAPFENRFADLPMNNPVAIALADGGRAQLVLNQGTQNLVILRRDVDGSASDVIGVVNVGNGASAIALTNSGTHVYVWNQFDVTVTEFELPMFEDRIAFANGTFVPDTQRQQNAEFEPIVEFDADTFVVAEDALDANVSEGRKLFHSATDTRISQARSISCATCHPDGRTDNRTWQFTFGPRNTPQLGGGILETAPFHWPGDVADIPDLNRMTVLAFMGGSGVDDESMESIGAFIDTIRPAPSAAALNPGLTAEQLRGQELFYSDSVGCAECHNGVHFTDNISYDVETQANTFDISRFQTPVLHGLARSGPYLHDGSARTLLELVIEMVATDKMGTGSHLSDSELVDLAAFLETL